MSSQSILVPLVFIASAMQRLAVYWLIWLV
jgi:hypothetical protein